MTTRTFARIGAGIAGAALLAGIATAATAAELGDSDVDVSVDIAPVTEPGALARTLAGDTAVLAENGSTTTIRQFTGELPTVTVSDTRDPESIPEEAFWSVLGSVSDFTNQNGDVIGAGHLGWQPRMIDAGESGLVNSGERVDTIVDQGEDATGLVDQELFAIADNSREVAGEENWTATADLFLRTPADITPGAYSGTLTLSLFE